MKNNPGNTSPTIIGLDLPETDASSPSLAVEKEPHSVPNNYLKCLFFNARSMRGETFSELKCLTAQENFDIITIAETFLDTVNIDLVCEYQLQGYKLFNRDRINRRGGGVAIYVKNCLNPTLITHHNNNSEIISVTILTLLRPLNITVVYRRPGQTIDEDCEMYNTLTDTLQNNDSVIVGDFNLPNINWQNHTGVESESHRLLTFIDDNFLHQHVRHPTRDNNILDLVISSQEHLITSTHVGEQLSKCDHNLVRFIINLPTTENKNNNVRIPNYRLANYESLNRSLTDLRLNENDSAEKMWNSFKQQFLEKQSRHTPTKN